MMTCFSPLPLPPPAGFSPLLAARFGGKFVVE
jgi:hypothetical protein